MRRPILTHRRQGPSLNNYSYIVSVNSDGKVNVTDLLAIEIDWDPYFACPEDINIDENIIVVDLLVVVGNWG